MVDSDLLETDEEKASSCETVCIHFTAINVELLNFTKLKIYYIVMYVYQSTIDCDIASSMSDTGPQMVQYM